MLPPRAARRKEAESSDCNKKKGLELDQNCQLGCFEASLGNQCGSDIQANPSCIVGFGDGLPT